MAKLILQNAIVNTAGAYVCIDGYFLFTIGIRPYQGRIPVVRLGGHREGGGQAILTGEFDRNMLLEPFIQLQLLSKILKKQEIR